MHACTANWLAIGRMTVNYARGSHAFSAGTKCWRCSYAHHLKVALSKVENGHQLYYFLIT